MAPSIKAAKYDTCWQVERKKESCICSWIHKLHVWEESLCSHSPLVTGIGERGGGWTAPAPLPTQTPKWGLAFPLYSRWKKHSGCSPRSHSDRFLQQMTVLESREQFAALHISTRGNLERAEPVPAAGARSSGDSSAGRAALLLASAQQATCYLLFVIWQCLFSLVLHFRRCGSKGKNCIKRQKFIFCRPSSWCFFRMRVNPSVRTGHAPWERGNHPKNSICKEICMVPSLFCKRAVSCIN